MIAMRRIWLSFLLVALLAAELQADLRIKTKDTFAGRVSESEEYYRGNCYRHDAGRAYTIVDSEMRRVITVDSDRREYSVHTFGADRRRTDPSRTIIVSLETRDTGERKIMFDRLASHLITSETRHSEPLQGSVSEASTSVIDGWYLAGEAPFRAHNRIGTVAVLTASTQPGEPPLLPTIRVLKKGPVPRGMAVWERIGNDDTEVTELSPAPLDPALFEAPADFRRVIRQFPGERLSWTDRLLLGWQEFGDWLSSL